MTAARSCLVGATLFLQLVLPRAASASESRLVVKPVRSPIRLARYKDDRLSTFLETTGAKVHLQVEEWGRTPSERHFTLVRPSELANLTAPQAVLRSSSRLDLLELKSGAGGQTRIVRSQPMFGGLKQLTRHVISVEFGRDFQPGEQVALVETVVTRAGPKRVGQPLRFQLPNGRRLSDFAESPKGTE